MNSAWKFLPPLDALTVLGTLGAVLAVLLVIRYFAGPPAAISRRGVLYALRAATLVVLALLLANPAEVSEQPGSVEAPDLFCLFDASQSMSMGTGNTRWGESLKRLSEAAQLAGSRSHARLVLFKFGQKMAALSPEQVGLPADLAVAKPAELDELAKSTTRRVEPTESDTQLAGALRQLSSRFGRAPPAGIVVFSDGQARDAADLARTAAYFQQLQVPIHVVPVGDIGKGGDVAIVGVVAPDRVRRHAEVDVQVFLRSYGYDGRRAEVSVSVPADGARPARKLTTMPVILSRGVQSATLAFQSDEQTKKLEVHITPLDDETSLDNNRFATEIAIDRTKIRVLYIEGNAQRIQSVLRGNRYETIGPFSPLQEALAEDPDIECIVLAALPGRMLQRINSNSSATGDRGFPDTVAELAAFDCLVLSNVGPQMLDEKHLTWIDNWISQRGGGLCMAGGESSFAAGGWRGTPLENLLPVEMVPAGSDWNPGDLLTVTPLLGGQPHPIWHIVADEKQNGEIVRSFPAFSGANLLPVAKSATSTVLATAPTGQGDPKPVLVAGKYGKGRSLALAGAITEPWASDFLRWGQSDRRYYAKFWRNCVYWLTENSSIGRRRLVATADKKYYRPGETIALSAAAFDEGAARTVNYRIVAMVEPAASSTDLDSDYSPIRWPDGRQRSSGYEGPFIAWGEEFELTRGTREDGYRIELPVREALSAAGATQAVRLELTAYEDQTQVDSTSLNLQVLDDPFELQNPFPNHELLGTVAKYSGGSVLSDAESLARLFEELPVKVGASSIRRTPLWNRWWLVGILLGLLTAEWWYRRSVGLA